MAEQPVQEVDAWTEFCDLVIVHAETADWRSAVRRIERRGAAAGIAVSPDTALAVVPADLAVLCMSIVPGTAGGAFDPRTIERVEALRSTSEHRRIGVDGGVRRSHVGALASAGADWVVVGSDLVFGGLPHWQDLLT
jgi:ribulose-phosphate 3-epimerase